jgi:hypothetical protein
LGELLHQLGLFIFQGPLFGGPSLFHGVELAGLFLQRLGETADVTDEEEEILKNLGMGTRVGWV